MSSVIRKFILASKEPTGSCIVAVHRCSAPPQRRSCAMFVKLKAEHTRAKRSTLSTVSSKFLLCYASAPPPTSYICFVLHILVAPNPAESTHFAR